jgi:hypothetical protein
VWNSESNAGAQRRHGDDHPTRRARTCLPRAEHKPPFDSLRRGAKSGATLHMAWFPHLICNPQARANFKNQDGNSRRDADPEPNRTLTSTDLYSIAQSQDARSETRSNGPRREAGDSKIEERDKSNDHVHQTITLSGAQPH